MDRDEHAGAKLRRFRERAGWTQLELAQRMGLASHAPVARMERSPTPSLLTVRRVIAALMEAEEPVAQPWEWTDLAETLVFTPRQRASRDDPPLIALMVPSLGDNAFWGDVVGAIQRCATKEGYLVLVLQHDNKPDSFFDDLYWIEEMTRLAGLIAVPPLDLDRRRRGKRYATDLPKLLARLAGRGVPTIFLDRKPAGKLTIPFVGVDNRGAAVVAVRHLYGLGHTRIAGLFGLQGDGSPHQERLAGYRAEVEALGLTYDDRLVSYPAEGETGIDAAQRLFDLPDEQAPTAVFCATHYLALDLVETVRLRRAAGQDDVVIPKTLSVIGFDNAPALDSARPRVARVYYDVGLLGQTVIGKLVALRENPANPEARRDVRIDAFKVAEAESVAPPLARSEPARPIANRVSRRRPPRPSGPGGAPHSGDEDPRTPPRISLTGRRGRKAR
jgi:DNA-binding LacI/PurR family transcriptional regulator